MRLTVNGASYEQPLLIKMDPRVKTSTLSLEEQFTVSKRVYDALKLSAQTAQEVKEMRAKAAGRSEILQKLDEFEGRRGARLGGGGRLPVEGPATLSKVTSALETLIGALQDADVSPTAPQRLAVQAQLHEMDQLMERWKKLKASI